MPRHLFFSKEPSLLFAEPAEPAEGDDASGAASEMKAPPQWVHILPKPKDGLIHSRDNRILHVDDLESLAKRSNAALKKQKGGGPVDADHRIYGWPGGGKALGWAEEFEARANGLWARTDWLDEGKQLIGDKLYRYTSSVVSGEMEPEIDEEAWSVTWHITPDIVEGFALTNIPALTTHALFSQFAQSLPLGFAAPGEREEALQVLLRKMGLAANASPTDIREAWAAFSKKLAAASAALSASREQPAPAPAPPVADADDADDAADEDDADEDAEDASEAEGDDSEAKDAKDDSDDSDAKAGTVEQQLAAAKARIKKFEEEAGARYVDELVHSGKLAPAQKSAALAQAKTEKGLAQLRALYEHATPIINPGGAPPRRSSTTSKAPPGVNPIAYEYAGKEPAHVIARRIQEDERRTKEHAA